MFLEKCTFSFVKRAPFSFVHTLLLMLATCSLHDAIPTFCYIWKKWSEVVPITKPAPLRQKSRRTEETKTTVSEEKARKGASFPGVSWGVIMVRRKKIVLTDRDHSYINWPCLGLMFFKVNKEKERLILLYYNKVSLALRLNDGLWPKRSAQHSLLKD